MVFQGRRKLISEHTIEDTKTQSTVLEIVSNAMQTHELNKWDIDYLVNYKNGLQPILLREKIVREEIKNDVVINHAQMVTRNIVGYFLGTPIQYIQNGTNKKEEIDKLNRYVAYEDKASVDKEIGEYQSICGTAFRLIYTDDGLRTDEVPFEDRALNPSTTFVVYENSVAERPLLGVTYYNWLNKENAVIGIKYFIYTSFGMYVVKTGNTLGVIDDEENVTFSPYDVGGVPLIEYPNNIWRIGDWELLIGLCDAINLIQSDRMDDIDQIVQSLVVFINAEIDPERYDEMRKSGVISLINKGNAPTDVKNFTNSLDQAGMNLFSMEMEGLLYALLGIPDRNTRSGGTSGEATGQAVELRDGWADLEIIARNKELIYKKSEKQALKIILTILNNKDGLKLSPMDVEIKFTRNKNNNLLVKAQGFMNLLTTKTLSPEDCLAIVDLVSDVQEYIARGKAFWGEDFCGIQTTKLQNAPKIATTSDTGSTNSDNSTN